MHQNVALPAGPVALPPQVKSLQNQFNPPPFFDLRQLQRVAKFLGIGPQPDKDAKPLRIGVLGASQASATCY